MDRLSVIATVAVPEDPDAKALKRVKEEILRSLRGGSNGDLVVLDLEGARLRASQLRDILQEPLLEIVQRNLMATPPPRRTYLVGLDPNGDNEWDATAALRMVSPQVGETLMMVWRVGGERPRLVGVHEDAVSETYSFVSQASSGTTSRAYYEETGLSSQAASNRMSRATGLGLIHPIRSEPAPGGGVRSVYVAVR